MTQIGKWRRQHSLFLKAAGGELFIPDDLATSFDPNRHAIEAP
jgi:hypothetical protein